MSKKKTKNAISNQQTKISQLLTPHFSYDFFFPIPCFSFIYFVLFLVNTTHIFVHIHTSYKTYHTHTLYICTQSILLFTPHSFSSCPNFFNHQSRKFHIEKHHINLSVYSIITIPTSFVLMLHIISTQHHSTKCTGYIYIYLYRSFTYT